MKVLLIALACFSALTTIQAKKGYILTAPKIINAGSSERICLTLTDITGPGTVQVKLLNKDVGNVAIAESVYNYPRDEQCFLLEVPNVQYPSGRIYVKGDFKQDDFTFESEAKVSISHKSYATFIQTDKSTYKASQKVLFRILTVNRVLEPVSGSISKAYIETPDGTRVAQWLNVDTKLGLAQLEFQLTDEPALGNWKIYAVVNGVKNFQVFEVKEYVLPKFAVSITPPLYLLSTDQSSTWKICAFYTYGKGVVGKLNATFNYDDVRSYRGFRPSTVKNPLPEKIIADVDINGCYEVVLDRNTMKWNSYNVHYLELRASAVVEEKGTDVTIKSFHQMKIAHEPLKMKFLSSEESYLKPGLPYFDDISVTKLDGQPAINEKINVCVTSSYIGVKECKDYLTNDAGIVAFGTVGIPINAYDVRIEAKASNHPTVNYEEKRYRAQINQPIINKRLKTWFSPTSSFLNIKTIHKPIQCDSDISLQVDYTTSGEDIKMFYQVMSRGKIVEDGMTKIVYDANSYKQDDSLLVPSISNPSELKKDFTTNITKHKHVGRFMLPLNISYAMSPISRVLLYYIRPDGETVSGHTNLDVMPCFGNKVSLEFDKQSIKPGTVAKYKINAAENSVCALTGVDKSSRLIKSDNQITKEKVFKFMKSFDEKLQAKSKFVDNKEYCSKQNEDETSTELPLSTIVRRRPRPRPNKFYTTNYVDSLTAFTSNGQEVISNLEIENRPCKANELNRKWWRRPIAFNIPRRQPPSGQFGQPGPVSIAVNRNVVTRPTTAADEKDNVADVEDAVNDAVEIRNYFPETWLWDLKVVGTDGKVEDEATIPHTITNWVVNTYCIAQNRGLGISSDASIKAFQPFFVSYSLPYSVVRKEKVPIIVSVFNYLDNCIPIKLTLEKSDFYNLLSNGYTKKICVCGGQPATHRFKILPIGLGQVNLTVYSYSLKDENHEVCSIDKKATAIEARDAITRPLLVEPEGFPQETTESILFCPSETSNKFRHSFELNLPSDLVEGSARSYFSISGDIMGPSLSGLEKLVALPTGCGEQNMIIFAPNIFVMQYLKGTDSLTSDIESKALGFMKTGYQRELTYRHRDGSYSAFGESDKEGSLWLTAFVVKSFAQAQEFIDIDPDDLKKSTKWLLDKQQEDGCFPFVGMLHHQDMKGGIKKSVPTALTAYTLISLLEAGAPVERTKIDKAFQCLNRDTAPPPYSLALSAYAASLDKQTNLASNLLGRLYTKATEDESTTYWDAASKSVSVEIGSYAILTLLNLGGATNQGKALRIIKWIAKQRNSRGGFISTQDTVMALQAFAGFGINQTPQNMKVKAEANSFNKDYNVTVLNKLLMQTDKILDLPNIVQVEATGEGCGLAQATVKYNVHNVKASEAFDLTVETPTERWLPKNQRNIKICAKYKIPNEKSNMAIVNVKMVSGYIPKKSQLQNLKRDTKLNLKRFELDANYVNFYFDYLSNDQTCLTFSVEQEFEVEDVKPATVSVYDYYLPELKLEKSYSLSEIEDTTPKPHIEILDAAGMQVP